MGQYDSLPSTVSAGDIGKLADLQTVYTGLKSSAYFVPNSGGDMQPDIQAALNDATSDGGAAVHLGGGPYELGTVNQTDSYGDKCALKYGPQVALRGEGQGNGRSGGVGAGVSNAPTELHNSASPSLAGGQKYNMISINNASPDWSGAHISGMHLDDDVSTCDSLLTTSGINGVMVDNMSFAKAGKTGSKCLWIRTASAAGQASQYGRVINCNFWADTHAIYIDGNNPDWEIHATQMQHTGGTSPVSGACGVYSSSSAIRIFAGEIQMFDIGVYIDGVSAEGKHHTLFGIHFEGHQLAPSNVYEAAIKIRNTGGAADQMPLIIGCELGNDVKFVDAINIGSNVQLTNIQHFRVRGKRWMTTGDSLLVDNGTGTIVSA